MARHSVKNNTGMSFYFSLSKFKLFDQFNSPQTASNFRHLLSCATIVRSYLDFLLSFNYPLRVLILFKLIAKANRASGITKTSYISHVLLLELKYVSPL